MFCCLHHLSLNKFGIEQQFLSLLYLRLNLVLSLILRTQTAEVYNFQNYRLKIVLFTKVIHDDISLSLLSTFYYVAITEICCLYVQWYIRDLLRSALKIRDSQICCRIWTASAWLSQGK